MRQQDGHINQRTQDKIRAGIKVQEIVNKLSAHILKGIKMTNTQVRAAEILLRKVTPDLTAQTLTASTSEVPLLQIVKPEPDKPTESAA